MNENELLKYFKAKLEEINTIQHLLLEKSKSETDPYEALTSTRDTMIAAGKMEIMLEILEELNLTQKQ